MRHTIAIKVRGYHLDLFRHVNNARYLEFLEEGRWSFLEAANGLRLLEEQDAIFVVVNININYRRPAYMGEILDVSTHIKKIGNRSCVLHQAITLQEDGTPVADADVVFVIVEAKTGQAVSLQAGPMRAILEQLMGQDQVQNQDQSVA